METGKGLFERERELAAIDAAVAAGRSGRSSLLILEGAAGIGKSRLVAEARRRAAEAGLAVLGARGSELERDFPFGVVRQLFEGAALGPRGEELLAGAAAAARPIFTTVPAGPDDADASFAALHGLYWLTVNVAGDDPLVLVVDDLHWCDRPSLRYLAYLVKRLDGVPVSVVTSLRPAEPGVDAALVAELTTDPLATTLHPAGLTSAASAALVGERLGAEPDAAFTAACHEATGGNPLLLTELVKAMDAEGVRPDAGSVAVVRDLGPRAASRSVLLRLARLPEECVAVARAVAVLGDGAGLDDVAALAGRDRACAMRATGELARTEILRPGEPLGFVHPLVRAAVYEDLPAADRESAHERAARLLADAGAPSDQVASQLLPTPGRGDPWVVATLDAAATTAAARGAPDSAVAYLTRALREPPPADELPGVLLRLGLHEANLQGRAALEHLRAAYETTRDPLMRARTAAHLAPLYFFLGMAGEGAAVADRAIAELPAGHDDLRDELESTLVSVALYDPGTRAVDDPRLQGFRTARFGDGPGARLLAGVTAYHWAMTGGPAEPCVRLARHALGGGLLAATRNGAIPHVAAQLVLIFADATDGLDATVEAYRAAHRSGSLFASVPGRSFQGMCLTARGELADAESLAKVTMREIDVWGFVAVRLFPGALLAHTLIEMGDLARAAEALEHANPGGAPLPHSTNSAFWLSSRMRFLLESGRLDDVLDLADDCRARFEGIVVNPAWIGWRSMAAEALDRLGRGDEAAALCREELELARAWGAPGAVGRALRVLGGALREAGLDPLREAVEVTEGTPAALEHAKALAAYGRGLRLARRPTDAREPLRRALELATVFGAAPLAEHARTELAATGARPRTEALSGVGALTASERRVAEAAAQGQTNKDIAQTLFVTAKTVEVHLSNAYRKLGIRSRRELTGALAV